jgi:hypothetical protein
MARKTDVSKIRFIRIVLGFINLNAHKNLFNNSLKRSIKCQKGMVCVYNFPGLGTQARRKISKLNPGKDPQNILFEYDSQNLNECTNLFQ